MEPCEQSSRTTPKVSIGMPVYNGERFIREALDSLLAQTFADFELIISDNASTDATESICRSYAERDARVRYLRQRKNIGAIPNFQAVLNEARGEYFMWAAADDVWDTKWIDSLLPLSAAHQCLAYGCVQIIDANSERKNHPANRRRFEFIGTRLVRRCKYFVQPGFLGKGNPVYGIMPLSYLRKIGIVWIESEHGGDMIFLFVLLGAMEIRQQREVYLYKRVHTESVAAGRSEQVKPTGVFAKAMVFWKSVAARRMFAGYVRRSSGLEFVLLIGLYPVCLGLSTAYACLYKLRESMKP